MRGAARGGAPDAGACTPPAPARPLQAATGGMLPSVRGRSAIASPARTRTRARAPFARHPHAGLGGAAGAPCAFSGPACPGLDAEPAHVPGDIGNTCIRAPEAPRPRVVYLIDPVEAPAHAAGGSPAAALEILGQPEHLGVAGADLA